MERRFYVGIGILIVLLCLGLLVSAVITGCQLPMAETLDAAARAADAGDFQRGITLAREAGEAWYTHWKGVASVADHTPMDEIDSLFSEMEVYIRTEEPVHFSACCAQLSSLLRAVSDAHTLSWWNVL